VRNFQDAPATAPRPRRKISPRPYPRGKRPEGHGRIPRANCKARCRAGNRPPPASTNRRKARWPSRSKVPSAPPPTPAPAPAVLKPKLGSLKPLRVSDTRFTPPPARWTTWCPPKSYNRPPVQARQGIVAAFADEPV
jgi:hypothetical protein